MSSSPILPQPPTPTSLIPPGSSPVAAASSAPKFLRQIAHALFPNVTLVNADALSYAASPERLASGGIEKSPRYKFVKCNIAPCG